VRSPGRLCARMIDDAADDARFALNVLPPGEKRPYARTALATLANCLGEPRRSRGSLPM